MLKHNLREEIKERLGLGIHILKKKPPSLTSGNFLIILLLIFSMIFYLVHTCLHLFVELLF